MSVGEAVGALVGTKDGCGVGAPRANVGDSVGSTVGALEGDELGCGVGNLILYVGVEVGSTVGSGVGSAEGSGVGDATVLNVMSTMPDVVAAELSTTSVPLTAMTVVPVAKDELVTVEATSTVVVVQSTTSCP